MKIGEGEDRPLWTLKERATRVWSEDEATVSDPDHETVNEAFLRIYKVPVPRPLETWDAGDAVYELLPASLVVVRSYPGNDEILAFAVEEDLT